MDQAVGYMCSTIEHELESAGHRPSKEEKKARAARERILAKYTSGDDPEKQAKNFADPASFFK